MDYSRIVFENAGDTGSMTSPGYAFVGIYASDNHLVFRLPIGYPKPAAGHHYDVARDLHIKFFKLFCRFRAIAARNRERLKIAGRIEEDAGPAAEGGREWIARHEEGDVYYYRHFDMFDSLLDAYDELKIIGLEGRMRMAESPPADLRNFQQADAGRLYQDDDSFFDDTSLQRLATVTLVSSDLIGLYCFLLRDLRDHIWAGDDPDPLPEDIRVLAERFADKHLWSDASCWEAAEWQTTREVLREKLDIIDRITALKDEDYDRLYEAVERFLYPPLDSSGVAGKLWGLDGFWPVWEWLVLTRLTVEPEFRSRLRWIETGNLTQDTLDNLKREKFDHPGQDQGVLCRNGMSWDDFLENGKKIGHPYPDAIVDPAYLQVQHNSWNHKSWVWIDKLTLTEGPVAFSLTGMNDHLAISTAAPTQVQIRRKAEKNSPYFSETEELSPVLMIMGEQTRNLDRPEVTAMLRGLGTWLSGDGAVGRFKPFKTLKDVRRRHMSGLLLVDAKYKKIEGHEAQWADDHRKQSAYEDALTISCPDAPAGYSIYICPGSPVTNESLRRLSAEKDRFDREFDAQWTRLEPAPPPWEQLKNIGQNITVLGQTTVVGLGGGQREAAYNALIEKVCGADFLANFARNQLACALLNVERFPGNDNFFVKNWSIRDLIDDMLNVG